MRVVAYVLFLVFFILTAVLILGNLSYTASAFFFLAPFQNQSLALPFLGFAVLGMVTGIFFVLSLYSLFSVPEKPAESISKSKADDNSRKADEKINP